jgi:diguanylate cyclase (GGDEF)-like protein/putative nucleotidyltransferase with HDIG domain
MRTLPLKAQLYLLAVVCCGIGATLAGSMSLRGRLHDRLWELLLFAAISAVAFGRKIILVPNKAAGESGTMTLGFAITFAAMLRLGPVGALIVGIVGCLSTCLFPKRQQLHQLCFNVAVSALASWTCGYVFWSINGAALLFNAETTFPAVSAAALTYYLINTFTVAGIISLCTDRPVMPLWKETFLWTGPSYFAGACIGSIAVMVFHSNAWQIVLFVSPIAYLTYQSYSIYVSRAQDKQAAVERLAHLYLSTIKSLALAIDAKDQYTHQHILRVQRYAVGTAKKIGLSGDLLEAVNTGALLHDIGKLGVPEYVLLKPGRLTDEEFEKVKKHPVIGAAILDPVEFPWPVLPVVKYHHEKWDGTGYPEGLKGEDIPLTARILAVADVYDALTSTRSYRMAWPHEKAVAEIVRLSGTHFDPAVVDAFVAVIDAIVIEMSAEEQQTHDDALLRAILPSKTEEAAREIQRASSELWALYEVADSLSSSLGIQECLDILGRKLEAILPGTTCLFLLRDQDGDGGLTVRSAAGPSRDIFIGARTLNALSRSVQVAGSDSYRGPYDHDDLLMVGKQDSNYEELRSSVIVPVVYEGSALGTINVYHGQQDAFNAHDQQLLEMIAMRASAAIYNGLQFELNKSNSQIDPVTGLYNMRYLVQHVEDCCARAEKERGNLTILCLDLDSFGSINDNFGHHRGDAVLRGVADVFRSILGDKHVIARTSGDEFVVAIAGDTLDPDVLAAQLQEAVENFDPGLIHDKLGPLNLALSAGIGRFPGDGTDFTTLISAAETCMHFDKTERKLRALSSNRRQPNRELRKAA